MHRRVAGAALAVSAAIVPVLSNILAPALVGAVPVGLLALASPPARAQPSEAPASPALPRARLTAGMHVIQAEVAADFATRARGLMHRERLGANEGMLFVFERADGHCFWMRNTPLPLSIAFVDDAGTIVNIEDMQPRTDDSHCPLRPIRYALEMQQGWFAKRGIAPGMKLVGLPRP